MCSACLLCQLFLAQHMLAEVMELHSQVLGSYFSPVFFLGNNAISLVIVIDTVDALCFAPQ